MKRVLPIAALALLAGCFDEPVPAYKTVAPETQVYLNDGTLETLTKEAVYNVGLVYVEGSGKTNLSARVEKVDFNTISYLNLDRNALTNVDVLADFHGLKWLRLNGNALSDLPELPKLKNLRRVYLADNRLKSVPEALKRLPSLTDVDLSGNPIEAVPEWFALLKGMDSISLSRTKVKSLPENISSWRSLKTLQMGDLDLSEDEMKRIRAALPLTRVVF